MNRESSSNSDSQNQAPIEPNIRRAVTFDAVEIIELPFTLGDNPSVSHGAPLSTEWNAQQRTILNLEAYELHRCHSRRSAVDLVVSQVAREALLLRHGFSQGEIADAAFEAARLKNIRKKQSIGRLSPPLPSSFGPPRLSPTATTRTISDSIRSKEQPNDEQLSPMKPAQSRLEDNRWDTTNAERGGDLCLPQHKRQIERRQRHHNDNLVPVPIPLPSPMSAKSLSPV
jgi:hypothetical protein